MKKILSFTIILLLHGCGGEEGLGPAGNVNDFKNFNSVMSVFGDMNTFLASDPVDANALMPNNIPRLSYFAPDYSTCSKFVIGSDENDDHYKLEYNCSGVPDSGASNDYKGYIEQDIEDRSELDLGYKVAYDLHEYRKNNNGTHIDSNYRGLHSLKKTSSKYTREYEFYYAVEGDWEPVPVDWLTRRQTKFTYTPVDMNDMMKKGKIELEGAFEVSGLLGPDGNGKAIPKVKFGLSYKSKNLTYDDSCVSTANFNGSIIYNDGANNKIEVVYSCLETGMKVFLNGVEQQRFFNP